MVQSREKMVQVEETRKGPWTEHEDVQLVLYVNLFGDRRWDFIAKVSGLKRTGKSCRLRWVNYLHPGLKRGKMTPHEERLVLELHAKWGNRWSRIARKLPGRTDNEIKNYWRTHMRKKAQERKRAIISPSSSSSLSNSNSNSNSSSSSSNNPQVDSMPISENKERNFYDTGGLEMIAPRGGDSKIQEEEDNREKGYSMDEIWRDIALSEFEDDTIKPPVCNFNSYQPMTSPIWDYGTDSLWMINDEDESKMIFPISDHQFNSFYPQETASLTG